MHFLIRVAIFKKRSTMRVSSSTRQPALGACGFGSTAQMASILKRMTYANFSRLDSSCMPRARGWRETLATALILACVLQVKMIATGRGQSRDAWLCIAEHAIGFKYNKARKDWHAAIFDISNEKYVIRHQRAGDFDAETSDILKQPNDEMWSVETVGSPPAATCGYFNRANRLFCEGILSEFIFNRQTLRFQYYYKGEFLWPPNEARNPDTPSIAIGRCTGF